MSEPDPVVTGTITREEITFNIFASTPGPGGGGDVASETSDGEWRIPVKNPDGEAVGYVGYSVSEDAVAFWRGGPGLNAYDKPAIFVYGDGSVYLTNANGDAGVSVSATGTVSFIGSSLVQFASNSAVEFTSPSIGLYGLPTSDPESADHLWNDGGTLKISAG